MDRTKNTKTLAISVISKHLEIPSTKRPIPHSEEILIFVISKLMQFKVNEEEKTFYFSRNNHFSTTGYQIAAYKVIR